MNKTIEELEGDVWGEPEFDSGLVQSVHRLRKKPTGQFTVEELRLMIGQNEGTRFLLPRAFGLLEQDPLVWEYHSPGELLAQVLQLPDEYWTEQPAHLRRAVALVQQAELRIGAELEQQRIRRERQTAWLAGQKSGSSGSDDEVEPSLLEAVGAFLVHHAVRPGA